MLTQEEIQTVDTEVEKLRRASGIKGFYPSFLTKGLQLKETDVVGYLDTEGMEKHGLRHRYVLHDEDMVMVGEYANLEDVPQDEMVENSYGEEVYVGENWHMVKYIFNRN